MAFIVLLFPSLSLCIDELDKINVPCFGPRQFAAQLESSKAFSKAFMSRHNIPTAKYGTFTDFGTAETYIRTCGTRVVIKASGLAAGKGVFVPLTTEEAITATKSILVDKIFGNAGNEVVIEEFIEGTEVSVLAFTDGTTVIPLPPAQDHKRAYEFDKGLNTGGMGAFAPSPIVNASLLQTIIQEALQPVIDGIKAEGTPYVGVLYAGLMIRPDNSFIVLEYNCRLGDPETQVILPLLETPFYTIVEACTQGKLKAVPVTFKKNVMAATIVAAAGGYPDKYAKGKIIQLGTKATGQSLNPSTKYGSVIFHAGTRKLDNGDIVTNGGRVLTVTSLAPTLNAALNQSYEILEDIHFEQMFYRRDIGGIYVRPLARTQPLRVAVLGSTRGSNLLPIFTALDNGDLPGVEIKCIISNKADTGILEKAKTANIPSHVVVSAGRTREDFDTEVIRHLESYNIDLVVLLGFMRILSPLFTQRYAWRIINVHPSLLPDFKGLMDLQVHEAVLEAGKTYSGCTVHFVDEGVDTGAILYQKACAVNVTTDTPETLKSKVQTLEGQALIASIKLFTDDASVNLLNTLRRLNNWTTTSSLLPKERLPNLSLFGTTQTSKLTYAQAGVDIDAGDQLVENIKPLAKSTARSGADADLGGFGGLFDLKSAGFKDPLLVSGTDGVGTKLKVAQIANVHDTVGIDLVAMSVNDIIVQGAEPLLFLDYFATGHLDVNEATAVISGIAEGCRQSGCALVGGETAEMPSMYAHGDYDLAGFAVGAVERDRVLPDLPSLQAGDVLLGLASSGVHSNGFSLVRKIISTYNIDWYAPPPFESTEKRLCDAVLRPTKIYVKGLLPSLKDPRKGRIKALAHITGGGLPDNLPRVLPDHLQAHLDAQSWNILPVFKWMQSIGTGVDPFEMARTFNLGIGMVLVVAAEYVNEIMNEVTQNGETVYCIGELRTSQPNLPQVNLHNLATAFGNK